MCDGGTEFPVCRLWWKEIQLLGAWVSMHGTPPTPPSLMWSLLDRSGTSEDDMDDMDDVDIQQIIIVTQTTHTFRKHLGGDRTGQSYNRSKLTSDIAQAIDVGLYFYEQVRAGTLPAGQVGKKNVQVSRIVTNGFEFMGR